jgi:hypothetical protein
LPKLYKPWVLDLDLTLSLKKRYLLIYLLK